MCSNSENGCGWVGELRSLENHLKNCEYVLICCTNKCMENDKEVRILHRDLDHHLKNECLNRKYECTLCKETGTYCYITTTHLSTCPQQKIPCRNVKCKVTVPRCEISEHRSECQFAKVPCKYAGIGCDKLPLHKDLERHLKNDSFHLHLAIETVIKQRKEMVKQRLDIKKLSDNILTSQSGPCVFKFPDYRRHKSSKQGWYSPPFYTHRGGYKMCMRVNANGFGDGTDTHVSMYAYLMKGRNDDNLPWSFTGEVTITLLNQLEDKSHHTCSVSFPHASNTSRRVVTSDVASDGCGLPKFISHDKLAAKNYQYLKDDCLFFRIEVQAAKPVKPWLTCTV